jgi:hypothetical protein
MKICFEHRYLRIVVSFGVFFFKGARSCYVYGNLNEERYNPRNVEHYLNHKALYHPNSLKLE